LRFVTAARFIAGFVACSTLASCSIDDRSLQSSGGDASAGSTGASGAIQGDSAGAAQAGKSGVSGGNDGGSSATTEAGAAGQSAPSPAPIATVGDCADLDEDGVADCQETLLVNPTFAGDVMHWTADVGASLTWDPRDSLAAPGSGTALLTAGSDAFDAGGSSLVTAGQCVRVTGGQIVIAYANAWVDEGQDANGKAEVYVDFYDAADCTSTSTSSFSTPQPLDASTGAWLTLKAALLTTVATHSARVMLAIEKPFVAQSFHARFDNVLLKTEPAN
jgi:hypothetical protein